ncbi:zinc finger and BTB domain-containing protein 26-like [Embiotoca jacksoni]|uniref:zinc finger and BTB domain-containing protein 26-like n=1 Tax=Embiotoca jacksoni TaxID=100190 RepID=UPI003703E5B3
MRQTIMSSFSDTLQLSLPTRGDSILGKMNVLREERRFCDITLILAGPQGPNAEPLCFHGHKVVLAASSDFLRDQFLLHEGRAELSVDVVSSAEVGETLLLSCYNGQLEVPVKELVSYLTTASALQMSQVVERCAQALSRYLRPTLAFLKLESLSEKQEIHQFDSNSANTSFKNQMEKDTAQPGTSIQEATTNEGRAAVIQSKLRVSQEAEVDSQGLREIREDRKVVKAKIELSEAAAYGLDMVESKEGGDSQPFLTNNSLFPVHHSTDTSECKLHPPAVFQDLFSSTASTMRRSSAAHEKLVESSQNQHKQEAEEETTDAVAAQLQQDEKLMASNVFCFSRAHLLKSHFTTEDSDSVLLQRPYLCRRCAKVFQHLESYVGHLKEHRQYLCLVCGKGFSQKTNLTRHIRVHTAVKPFRCPLCHKTFTQKAMLQDHLKLHTGDRPHKCNYSTVHLAHKAGLGCHLGESRGKSRLQNVQEEAVDCQ